MNEARLSSAGMYVPVEGEVGAGVPAEVVARGAFLPRPLPVPVLDEETVFELARLQEMLGRLDQDARRLSGTGAMALVRSTQVREVQGSASLDGVQTALREVLLARLPGRKLRAMPAAMDRYLRASEVGFDAALSGVRVDATLMCRVAAAFGDEVESDRVWRQGYAWLGGPDPAQAYLIAAPPGADLRVAASQFDSWSASTERMLVGARVAIGLYQWETLRPFAYGNGNIARLYVGMLLASSGVLSGQVLPISTWIDRNRAAYDEKIREVVETGCYEPWIRFIAGGIREVCEQELRLIQALERARDAMLARLSGRDTGLIRPIVADLVLMPVTNNRQVAEWHRTSRNNANDLCGRLTRLQILEEVDECRSPKAYYCPELLRLMCLTDPDQ